jgi:hypothetical protein
LPGGATSAIYDAANEVTNWNGLALNYDQNGNMLSDGSNSFTWNARNEVAKLNNVSLQYDAFGRRIQNASGTSFLYDGANVAQELSGSTVTANLLSGGIDEVLTRTDSSGSFAQLKDALGSTIALVDSSGNLQTSYTYDPYGGTSVTGTSNGNGFNTKGTRDIIVNRQHCPSPPTTFPLVVEQRGARGVPWIPVHPGVGDVDPIVESTGGIGGPPAGRYS